MIFGEYIDLGPGLKGYTPIEQMAQSDGIVETVGESLDEIVGGDSYSSTDKHNNNDHGLSSSELSSIDSIQKEWALLGLDDDDGEDLNRRTGWRYRVAKVVWDSADKHPKERAFLFKLDLFFLSSIMFGYFIKNLNQSNINTAYINGMQEHLNMNGSQLNYMQSLWTAGYIIGQIPSNFILHRVSARYYLGTLEFIWAILTVLSITVNTYQSMYALRFFVGLTESGFFPGVEYLLGAWYRKDELTKRSTLFACSGVAASMITGYLQAAIIKGLSHNRLTPYKWLFVFDAVISFPVAAYTMIANPNTPETTKSWYLNAEDRRIALARRKLEGAKPKGKYTKETWKNVFRTWHVWVFPLIFLAYNNSCNTATQPTFQGWLRSLGYTPVQYNVYPTAVLGAGIGFAIVFAWISDYLGGLNWPFVIAFFVCQIIGSSMLAAWNIPKPAHWAAYFLTGIPTAWGQPMVFAWLNRLLRADNEKRNMVVAITNNLAYVTNAWVPILTWNAQDLPRYFIGFTYTAVLSGFGLAWTILAIYLVKRDEKRLQNKHETPVQSEVAQSYESDTEHYEQNKPAIS